MSADESIALMNEIKKDEIALELLKAKARWEQMTLFAVLRNYGDPREWETYKQSQKTES